MDANDRNFILNEFLPSSNLNLNPIFLNRGIKFFPLPPQNIYPLIVGI